MRRPDYLLFVLLGVLVCMLLPFVSIAIFGLDATACAGFGFCY